MGKLTLFLGGFLLLTILIGILGTIPPSWLSPDSSLRGPSDSPDGPTRLRPRLPRSFTMTDQWYLQVILKCEWLV